MKIYFLAVLFVGMSILGFAQHRCGQSFHQQYLEETYPALMEGKASLQQLILDQVEEVHAGRAEKIIIPVVFHIIHNNGPENISDDQVKDGIRIMNEDFNAVNAELDEVIAAFQNIVGNGEIEFRLAAKDPNGDYTTGIDRIQSTETYVGDDGSKLGGWPRAKYLNIWVTDAITVVGTSAAAYALRPAFAQNFPSSDGVISNHRYVGSIGTANNSGSKTLTHEVGHYLDLPHTWGETNFPGCDGTATNPNDPCFGVNNCAVDDGISDTPLCRGVSNGGCNLSLTSCGSLDNVQNFMDYASCEAMFTIGQINRMRATLNSTVAERNKLWTSTNYTATGVTALTEARYAVNSNAVCRGETVQFRDESRYDPETWSWEITGPVTFTSTDQHPSFTFTTPGYYSVKLTVTQGAVTKSITKANDIHVSDVFGHAVPFTERFDEPMAGWIVVNTGFEDDQFKWQLRTNVGFDDNQSYMVNNFGAPHRNPDELILSSIDFRPMTSVNMSFKVAYARLNNNNQDRLNLQISRDCGATWTQVWSGNAAALNGGKPLSSNVFVPTSAADWESFTVAGLPLAWLDESTLIKFVFEPGGGNQLYLDNINITGDFSPIPFLVYPIDNAQQVNDNVTLDWRAVPGASLYEYQLSKVSDFSNLVASGSITVMDDENSDQEDTRFLTTALEHGATHYWRVRANVNGSNTAWSEEWQFSVAADGVGIKELAGSAMHLFPNPSRDVVFIQSVEPHSEILVFLYDLRGVLVMQETVKNMTAMSPNPLNINDLPSGTYFTKVVSLNQTWTMPFIIQK